MLVMTHKTGDKIYVEGDVEMEIEVVGVHGGKVQLGFKAPPSVRIIRDKVKDRDNERKNA